MRHLQALVVFCGAVMLSAGLPAACALPGAGANPGADLQADGQVAADGWRSVAEAKIERHRKGDFTVTVVDANGVPLRRTDIDYELDRHHFLFGTAVTGNPADEDSEAERRYRRFILEHFNALVCENAMKWYSVEKEPGRIRFDYADRLMAFAEEHGLAMRGHTLFWAKPHWVQDWIHELDDDDLRQAIDAHLERMVRRYRGRLVAWDVCNEMLTGHFFRNRLGEEVHIHMFKRAHELDPHTPLHVNEYDILGNDAKTDRYIAMVRRMKQAGAPIHGIGIQEHAAQRFIDRPRAGQIDGPIVPQDAWSRLDRIAEAFPELPIQLTEVSSRTPDAQRRAESLEMLFYTAFAHPQVEGILLWGFWRSRHFAGEEAALIDRNWNLLPAGQRISDLLTRTWHTRGSASTDRRGAVDIRGFFGTYRIQAATPDGEILEGRIVLLPDQRQATVVLKPQSR